MLVCRKNLIPLSEEVYFGILADCRENISFMNSIKYLFLIFQYLPEIQEFTIKI